MGTADSRVRDNGLRDVAGHRQKSDQCGEIAVGNQNAPVDEHQNLDALRGGASSHRGDSDVGREAGDKRRMVQC